MLKIKFGRQIILFHIKLVRERGEKEFPHCLHWDLPISPYFPPGTLMKAICYPQPGVNFINVKRANFTYECRFSSYILALSKNSYEKFARLTLMKLTAAVGASSSQIIGLSWNFFFGRIDEFILAVKDNLIFLCGVEKENSD